jgi:hypothetical protein
MHPAGGIALAAEKMFKKFNNSDYQVKTAFDRYQLNQRPTPAKPKFPYGMFAAAAAGRNNK